jgi:CMP-N-acetylneuraminic acid synthetase
VVTNTEVVVIIPARGGSKSIPRKNIQTFAGYPLIAYSIAAGLSAKTVNRVIVSTDDDEIADISRRFGAEVPFIRPVELAQDDTPDLPVFKHALEWLEHKEDYVPEIVVQLRPTSPFRRTHHIDNAVLKLIEHPEADAVRTVCIPFQNPYKMWLLDSDGFMQPLMQIGIPEPYNLPRQSLPEVFWQTGYVDVIWANTIKFKNSMTADHILPLIIGADEWIDIDSPDDWRRAERLLEGGEITFTDLGFQVSGNY